jgi:putative PEP-CTERM system histidine kinase
MALTVILWAHALAALLFGMIALSQVRDAAAALPRLTFVVALIATALWALAVAGIDAGDVATHIAEGLRDLSWLAFMYALVRRDRTAPYARTITLLYATVVAILLAGIGVAIVGTFRPQDLLALASGRVALRMMVTVSALVLVHHLYAAAAPVNRGGIRLLVVALAAMWGVDLVVYAISYVTQSWTNDLVALRGVAVALLAPLFGVAVLRNGDWTLRLSRSVAWQSLSLAAVILYLLVTVLATSLIAQIGGGYSRVAQTAFVFGSTAAVLTLVSSPWLKAWAKVKLAKHLFRHRYDYRAEWIRFTETLGQMDGTLALEQRVVKAVADLTDCPAGLLLVPEANGLGVGAEWNWGSEGLSVAHAGNGPSGHLTGSSRIIELDAVRSGEDKIEDGSTLPSWIVDEPEAWVLVPLVHLHRLQGAILLARPPVDRALDWEDFDLLRIVGRQVASHLAEARAQEALAEAERFDEFNRRFAFILHDIKNLVSQLTLTARNAERHAHNPDFRADMIATLQDSAGRMNALLARLSQHHIAQAEELRPTELLPLIERVAGRMSHPILVSGNATTAAADPLRLEQMLGHLVQNAIDASSPEDPVHIMVAAEGKRAVIRIVDTGCGMSPAFVRDKLFKPFVSSKPGGFGIGAFEAQQLADGMGGAVHVSSREGEGTTFQIELARASDIQLDQAA